MLERSGKEALRARMRARRDAMTLAQARAAAQLLRSRLPSAPPLRDHHHTLGAYAALGRELDVRPALLELTRRGHAVALPRVIGPGRMIFAPAWGDLRDGLRSGPWGLLEPTGEPIAPEALDVILVPGLAFDRGGGRLGMGGGFYDRFVAARRAAARPVVCLGICYDWQLVEEPLPRQAHDECVDWIVTPARVLRGLRAASTSRADSAPGPSQPTATSSRRSF